MTLLILVGLFTLPGLALLALPPDRRGWGLEELLLAVAVSMSVVAGVALVLLHLGWFQWWAMVAMVLAPSIVLLSIRIRQNGFELTIQWRDVAATGVLVVGLLALIAISPRWNFQIATGMDAGNYEIYANHFAESGWLYQPAIEEGVDAGWVGSYNAWIYDAGEPGQPAYMHAYPALLGVVREFTGGSLTSSWMLGMGLAATNLGMLYLLGRRLGARRTPLVLALAALVVSPIFLYYAKQVMSEQLGLVGFLMMLLAFVTGRDDGAGSGTPSEAGRWVRIAPWIAGLGTALTVATKLDALMALLLLTGVVFLGALVRWITRGSPVISSGTAVGAAIGAIVAAVINKVLVHPVYLGKTRAEEVVPWLPLPESLATVELYLPLAVLLALLLGVVAWMSRNPRRHVTGPCSASGSSRTRAAVLVVTLLWVGFVAFNLMVRPIGEDLVSNPDALNMRRLFGVASPGLLALSLTGAALWIGRRGGADRWIGGGVLLGFAWLIFRAGHTPPDVWWMRRYLGVIPPLAVFSVAGLTAWRSRPRLVDALLSAVLVLGVVLQWPSTAALLRYEQNATAPQRVLAVDDLIPDDVPLLVVAGDKVTRGLGLALGSRRSGITLSEVPAEDLEEAVAAVDGAPIYLISPLPLEELPERPDGFSMVAEADYTRQWQNHLASIRDSPEAEGKTLHHWIYARG